MEQISALQQSNIHGINTLARRSKVMLLEPVSALQRSKIQGTNTTESMKTCKGKKIVAIIVYARG
jgi:hypothetical protein